MNFADILSVLGGALLGLIVAYVNMRISKANMNASNMAAVMGVNGCCLTRQRLPRAILSARRMSSL